jgi:integral membrane sensor domain MASE1
LRPCNRDVFRLLLIGVFAIIYVIAGKIGLNLASLHASASPVWPPAGIALAAILLLGYRAWPAIFVGAFLVNLTTAGDIATSVAIASGNTLEAVAGALLVNRFAGGKNVLIDHRAFSNSRSPQRSALSSARCSA